MMLEGKAPLEHSVLAHAGGMMNAGEPKVVIKEVFIDREGNTVTNNGPISEELEN